MGYVAGGLSVGSLTGSVLAYQAVGAAPAAWPLYVVAAATAAFGVVTIALAARTFWRALESRRLDHEIEIARKRRELAALQPPARRAPLAALLMRLMGR
ncbi:MAG TPA: hypothetical protein VHH36_04175 [Candidatus Thermoplasmatota archaeon]|nr:hypothetical protein [Candidatus Thermoplasmatota archaeon]